MTYRQFVVTMKNCDKGEVEEIQVSAKNQGAAKEKAELRFNWNWEIQKIEEI